MSITVEECKLPFTMVPVVEGCSDRVKNTVVNNHSSYSRYAVVCLVIRSNP